MHQHRDAPAQRCIDGLSYYQLHYGQKCRASIFYCMSLSLTAVFWPAQTMYCVLQYVAHCYYLVIRCCVQDAAGSIDRKWQNLRPVKWTVINNLTAKSLVWQVLICGDATWSMPPNVPS